MEKKEMLGKLIDHYCNGNKAQFAAKIGIKPQSLSMWFSRNSFDAEVLYASCENVSAEWLLSNGEKGDMIIHTLNVNQENINTEELMKLRGEVDVLRELAGLPKKGSKVV